jgi:hypothetical protein
MRYLGPIREIPPANYSAPRFPDASRWASGLGAWDALDRKDESLVQSVNDWLAGDDRLAAGCRLVRRRFKEIDLSDPLLVQLQTGRAFDDVEMDSRIDLADMPTRTRFFVRPVKNDVDLRPQDVGVGISQIIPVLVTALDKDISLAAIEQPELHIHPRLQAALGDLFITTAIGQQACFLLETHSELLILRILKRIRETTANKNHSTPPITSEHVALFFVRAADQNTLLTELRIDKHGRIIDACPEGFFEEDFRELF